jgi:hypothetical protein
MRERRISMFSKTVARWRAELDDDQEELKLLFDRAAKHRTVAESARAARDLRGRIKAMRAALDELLALDGKA